MLHLYAVAYFLLSFACFHDGEEGRGGEGGGGEVGGVCLLHRQNRMSIKGVTDALIQT